MECVQLMCTQKKKPNKDNIEKERKKKTLRVGEETGRKK